MQMRIKYSKEDYLETILVLSQQGNAVRSVDVAEHLDYTKPSVSRARSLLAQDSLVTLDEHKYIHLTKEGRALAENVYEKHLFFKDMLLTAGVDENAAAEDACRIEHAISDESFDKMKAAFHKKEDG